MAVWRIEMLGRLRASHDDVVTETFPTKRTAALFAYLALFPRVPHSREVLGELFWPEAGEDMQRHSLRVALSRLRTVLGPHHPILAGRTAVQLDRSKFVTDVAEYEGAVARGDGKTARRLYAGHLLPGFYDEWVIEEQARLEALLDDLGEEDVALPQTLPQGLGRIFGRERELAEVAASLEEGRVVTLAGPGGIGKTRLAVAVAKAHGRGVWVPLADLSQANQVADAVRSSLHLPVPAPGFPIEDLVARELMDVAPVLLVLDNAEHILSDELTGFVKRLCATKGVSALATSRCALGIAEEIVLPVGPLSENESAALFEERARRARPGLTASGEAMRSLARRLGGMPLALELAAARAGVQDLAQIEALDWRADGDFGEALGITARHRSLDTVLKETLDLLPQQTRRAFDRLAVFRGGFDATAAEAVAGATLATLETLRRWALILPFEEQDGSLRFRMPEPLREVADGGRDASEAHLSYFSDWVQANRADDLPPPPRHFGQRLALQERERDNVRAALETCRASDDPVVRELGLRIVAAYWTHWYVRNAGAEMEYWATTLLDGAGRHAAPRVQAAARLSLALALRERGAREACAVEVEEALTVLREGPRDRDGAFAWHLRGFSLADLGRQEEAEEAYLKAEEIWKEIGDDRNFSITRHNRAMLAVELGELDKAEALVGEAMELFRSHMSTYLAIGWATVGSIRSRRGDFAGAAAALREASSSHHQMGYVRGWAQNERDLALALHALGRDEEARSLAEGALAAFRRVGDRHGEATSLVVLTRITGESWHAAEARGVLSRHKLPAVGELLESL